MSQLSFEERACEQTNVVYKTGEGDQDQTVLFGLKVGTDPVRISDFIHGNTSRFSFCVFSDIV